MTNTSVFSHMILLKSL